MVDDSTRDKFYAHKMELVTHHLSDKHARVVQGINLITLLQTRDSRILCDYQLYDKHSDGATKNDHFRSILQSARATCFLSKVPST